MSPILMAVFNSRCLARNHILMCVVIEVVSLGYLSGRQFMIKSYLFSTLICGECSKNDAYTVTGLNTIAGQKEKPF